MEPIIRPSKVRGLILNFIFREMLKMIKSSSLSSHKGFIEFERML